MLDSKPPRRAHYMLAVLRALRALGGASGPQAVFGWIRDQGLVNAEDEVDLPSGGNRFEKEARFSRMMLAHAGLIEVADGNRWTLTPAGSAIDLSPAIVAEILKTLNGVKRG